nr:ribonuclease H-like domain-containing protein [Tanacetum cinerariifolium]
MSVHNFVHNTPYNFVHNTPHNSDINDPATALISKLDLSNPFHLHPNDSAVLPAVFVKLKGAENYQLMKLMQHLMSLDDSYMQIKSFILLRESLPYVRSAFAIISNEESHRIASGSMSKTSQRSQTSAFIVNDPNRENFQRSQTFTSFSRLFNANRPIDNGNGRTAGGSTLVCENYGFNGHTIDKCFKTIRYPTDLWKKEAGSNFKGKNISNNAIGSSSSNGLSDEQITTLISLIGKNSANGKGVHSNIAGANQHITYTDKNLINVIDISYFKFKVTHPNGTEAFITKKNTPLTDYMTLYDVLVVPEYYTREPIPLSDYVSTQLGELVHLDLWGPYKVTSREGFRFFLTIVDDFSRAIWVYLLKSKTEVFHNTMVFYNLIKTQFKNNIKGGILLNIWSECVLTATYLINKLPTSVLNGKSSYDLVYDKPPSLNHLRSFSCLAYATILNSHAKFGSRSKKCVLVGNSNSKKGYKLWSLDNKQIIYSRDVKFFEDIFPFKQHNSIRIDISIQDVNHLNFFNTNTLDGLLDIPNDEERMNLIPIRHGNPPSHSGSTYAFSNENDTGNFQDADVSTSENGSFAANEDNINSSEGNDLHDHTQEANETKVCKLNKSLYGLKQTHRQWNAKLTAALLENNVMKYCLELIDEFGLLAGKPSNLPMQPNVALSSEPSDADPLLDNVSEYQKLIGKLIYLTTTKPDISYTVSCISRFMHNPLRSHMRIASKHIQMQIGLDVMMQEGLVPVIVCLCVGH